MTDEAKGTITNSNIYVVAYSAQRWVREKGRVRYNRTDIFSGYIVADSRYQARKVATRNALIVFPLMSGWRNHIVHVQRINKQKLQEVLGDV